MFINEFEKLNNNDLESYNFFINKNSIINQVLKIVILKIECKKSFK